MKGSGLTQDRKKARSETGDELQAEKSSRKGGKEKEDESSGVHDLEALVEESLKALLQQVHNTTTVFLFAIYATTDPAIKLNDKVLQIILLVRTLIEDIQGTPSRPGCISLAHTAKYDFATFNNWDLAALLIEHAKSHLSERCILVCIGTL